MRNRALRYSLAAVLLAAGLGAAFFASSLNRRIADLLSTEREVLISLGQVSATVSEIAAAEAAYVAPGLSAQPSFDRADNLLKDLDAHTTTVRPKAHSVEAAATLQAIADARVMLLAADTRARDLVRAGDESSAIEDIFGAARRSATAIATAAGELATAEAATFDSEHRALAQQQLTIVGGVSLLWLVGLVLLVPIASTTATAETAPAMPPLAATAATDAPAIDESTEESATLVTPPPAVDLATAADLCTALSRVTSASALPDMLARAAALLDASGIIVWLGAGDDLFAVTAHGYDPRVIGRLGPIARQADNATAAAWRSGEVRTVAGDMMANGAVVAPMFGPDSCIGVLAAEVRHGRETDAATRAVTSMIAAQLATIVSAWPAASTTSDVAATPAPRAAEA